MARALLLTACALFCLMVVADALNCRLCSSVLPGMPCMPPEKTCVAQASGACLSVLTLSADNQVQQKIMGCTPSIKKCNRTWDLGSGRRMEFKCCTTHDNCNEGESELTGTPAE